MSSGQKPLNEINSAMICDQYGLQRLWRKISRENFKANPDNKAEALISQFRFKLESSQERRKQRKLDFKIRYPSDLPVSKRVAEIKDLLIENQVVIVAGETGSGKSTQLPKICLELGLAEAGMIAHTQPRRIAARSLSSRIAEEIIADAGKKLEESFVACKVRFSDSVKEHTRIKLMTDGMLLAEIENDPFLEQYQCIILDEVHERSLNIDFLIGFLKKLLLKRKDLKLILTSATIDVDSLSQHFDGAPIIEVSGRSYPVNVEYIEEDIGAEPEQRLRELITELMERQSDSVRHLQPKEQESNASLARDILVFLATEKDIREHSRILRKEFGEQLEILPLYGRLPLEQQRRIFNPAGNKRRVILATNVAETSVTVPDIGVVIDTGVARVSRYRSQGKIQQLPIEKISQASANQRAGRCGRVAPGLCIRLYSEDDFNQRAEFTQPEIQRTNLATVLLKMANLGLGEIEDFPLLDAPDKRLVKDARQTLMELQAFDEGSRINSLGRKLANLSLDPAYGRVLLEAAAQDCLAEVLVIVTMLSINDPRLRPMESRQQADQKHGMLNDPKSDFLSILNLWLLVEENRRNLSSRKFRKFCSSWFLSFQAIQEWREIHFQISTQLRHLGFALPDINREGQGLDDFTPENNRKRWRQLYQPIHKSILKGFYQNIAHFDEANAYQGINHRQVYVFPSSVLLKQRHSWIVSAGLVETSRLYAHCCASIEVEWILQQCSHLIRKDYFEPHWSKRKGSVQVLQKSSYRGLTLEGKKLIRADKYVGSIIKEDLKAIFIQGALIERRYSRPPEVIRENWKCLDELAEMESKSRRADLIPTDNELLTFYHERIDVDVSDLRSFEKWLRQQPANSLSLKSGLLVNDIGSDELPSAFPDIARFGNLELDCEYLFDPSSEQDGLTLILPLELINQLHQDQVEWLVPGLLPQKIEGLLRSLPRALRKSCMPIDQTAQSCLAKINRENPDFLEAVVEALHRAKGVEVSPEDFKLERLETFLRPGIKVVDENGQTVIFSKSLKEIRKTLSAEDGDPASKEDKAIQIEQEEKLYSEWQFGDLQPEVLLDQVIGSEGKVYKIKKYRALVDRDDGVGLGAFDLESEAQFNHFSGQLRLMCLCLTEIKRLLAKELKDIDTISLKLFTAGDGRAVFNDLFECAVSELFFEESGADPWAKRRVLVYQKEAFYSLMNDRKADLFNRGLELSRLLNELAEEVFELRQLLVKETTGLRKKHYGMMQAHLENLIHPGFMLLNSGQMLRRYPLYIKGIFVRLERLQGNIDRDQALDDLISGFRNRLQEINSLQSRLGHEQFEVFRSSVFELEEFSMNQFAQQLKPWRPIKQKTLESGISFLEKAISA